MRENAASDGNLRVDAYYRNRSTGSSTTESYTYDAAGNRLSSVGVTLYSYNASNELTSNSTGTGAQTLKFSSIIFTRTGFSQTNTCGTQIGVGASCTMSVTLQPTVGGHDIATVNVIDDGGSSPQTAAVEGRGTK